MKSVSKKASTMVVAMALTSNAFVHQQQYPSSHASSTGISSGKSSALSMMWPFSTFPQQNEGESSLATQHNMQRFPQQMASLAASAALIASLTFNPMAAFAENELSEKYGGKGFDSSLVDQTCLVDRCSVQAKACLADDPSCRKGLTCTAKCLGDNSCITGCMARYGNSNLDNLLKCTIEDNQCIKIAILPGGADKYGEEPRAPKATVANFDYKSLQGTWYKVVGFNPNYDCYACQRNTFALPEQQQDGDGTTLVSSASTANTLNVGVEFSMPHLLPDGSPPPPRQVRESAAVFGKDDNSIEGGFRSIGLNEYNTNEVMVFDNVMAQDAATNNEYNLVLNEGKANEARYRRTAHSEGEMFGLKFWENWYVIGENDPDQPEFKFIYYNGKTRQNTYEGAFVYSRSRALEPESMAKVYAIAKEAGMNPDQFCRIRNGCFTNGAAATPDSLFAPNNNKGPANANNDEVFRGIIASTRVSELLGVEAVSAREEGVRRMSTSADLQPLQNSNSGSRPWWYEVGDYFERPHRHFEVMQSLRKDMDWPEHVRASYKD
ncbi:VDE lipocalin diadinoxanthin de-epoxidase domain containing protein [Nitzschia inconspicua]|uniref:VDE lipocalin diadinoxanthin de-epoxidase domain containing protein n=1 Tax=Nitzschia inconspicua TaxID=303405 RepID=A0A9K3KBQ1_9STRA|nr:VDE lipocalin diadinoxanthin de-epoxidase domain containing protein [Nitzschia inconspicua]